jgi:site-specific DNA-methyltransferase (adenine-specific)
MNKQEIWHGDCLELMKNIPDGSIDMVLCDLPYGNFTACKWDTLIDFKSLWGGYNRILKKDGVVLLFGSQPFTTAVIQSNLKDFKYCWYWKKSKPNGWQHSKNKPMTAMEEISVFSKLKMGHISQLGENRMRYFPQGIREVGNKKVTAVAHGKMMGSREKQIGKEYKAFTGFPHNVLEFQNVIGKKALHPTQKPVELLEYLIKTYTNESDLILDNCAGSGSTGVAAKNLNRQFILIEKEKEYYDICLERLK